MEANVVLKKWARIAWTFAGLAQVLGLISAFHYLLDGQLWDALPSLGVVCVGAAVLAAMVYTDQHSLRR